MSDVFRNIDPPPHFLTARRVCTPRLWCGGRTHSLGGEGVGGSIQFGRRQTLLCGFYSAVDPLPKKNTKIIERDPCFRHIMALSLQSCLIQRIHGIISSFSFQNNPGAESISVFSQDTVQCIVYILCITEILLYFIYYTNYLHMSLTTLYDRQVFCSDTVLRKHVFELFTSKTVFHKNFNQVKQDRRSEEFDTPPLSPTFSPPSLPLQS